MLSPQQLEPVIVSEWLINGVVVTQGQRRTAAGVLRLVPVLAFVFVAAFFAGAFAGAFAFVVVFLAAAAFFAGAFLVVAAAFFGAAAFLVAAAFVVFAAAVFGAAAVLDAGAASFTGPEAPVGGGEVSDVLKTASTIGERAMG